MPRLLLGQLPDYGLPSKGSSSTAHGPLGPSIAKESEPPPTAVEDPETFSLRPSSSGRLTAVAAVSEGQPAPPTASPTEAELRPVAPEGPNVPHSTAAERGQAAALSGVIYFPFTPIFVSFSF